MRLSDSIVGSFGENIACGYLSDKGYAILCRNYTTSFGEIDIIAKSLDRMLVFVEVKTAHLSDESGKSIRQSYPQPLLKSTYSYTPELRLNKKKLARLVRLAQWYMNNNFPFCEFRIDGVCIDLFDDGGFNIRHYENIGFA